MTTKLTLIWLQSSPSPVVMFSVVSLPLSVLQELQGADASAGREPAGLQRGLQGEAAEEEGAQAEGHSGGRGGHRAGPAEQGADGAVAEGETGTLGGGLQRFTFTNVLTRAVPPGSNTSTLTIIFAFIR